MPAPSLRALCWATSSTLTSLFAAATAQATTYDVGPGMAYTTLTSLPTLAPGDVVQVHPGTYNEARRWTAAGTAQSPITIRGVGTPRPIIDGTGVPVSGAGSEPRALFQFDAGHYVVENIEFTNARNGNNGAGIRVLADDVTVRGCKITYCDMGMMGGANGLVVEQSEVAFNGTVDFNGYSHNFYLDGMKSTIRFSYIHDALYGQNFKTRAHYTELLYSFIADSNEGEVGPVDAAGTDTSMPDSNMLMVGNIVVSKPNRTGNTGKFIDFGRDNSGSGSHNGTLYLYNNTLVAGSSSIVFITASAPDSSIISNNNIFYGSDKILGSAGAGVTGSNNWVPATATVPSGFSNTVSGAAPGFIDLANRNYRLAAGSPCVDAGTNAFAYRDGNGVSGDATPLFQYLHPLQSEPRVIEGVIDIGAYEFRSGLTDGGAGSSGAAGSGGASGASGGSGGVGASGGSGGVGASGGGGSSGTGGSPGTGGSTVGGSSGSLGASGGTAGSRASTGGGAGAAANSGEEGGCACQIVDSRVALGRALLAAFVIGAGWRLRRRRPRSVKSN